MNGVLKPVWICAPATALNVLLFAIPVVYFAGISFLQIRGFKLVAEPTLANYGRTITDYGSVVLATLGLSFITAAATTVLGFIYAAACRFSSARVAAVLITLSLLALFGGYLAKLYAWRIILGPNGVLNSTLMTLQLIDQPLEFLVFSNAAVVIALTHYALPLAILPLYASLRSVDDTTIAAARDLGASNVAILRDVLLPLTSTGVFAAFCLTFLLVAGDGIAARLLGGSSSQFIGPFILNQFGFRVNAPLGSAMAFTMIAASALVLAAFALLGRLLLRQRW